MIELRSVTKTYLGAGRNPAVTALNEVSLTVESSEFLVVTGRSGSGKTTLLNLAAGLLHPTSGEVLIAGDDLWKMSDKERSRLRNHKVGFVFQFPSLLPSLTTLENVALPQSLGGSESPRQEAGARERRAAELLDMVGLSDKLASFPRQLSAGQQQRAVIARALVNEPEILFADEPSSDLDEQTEQEIMTLFSTIHRDRGLTVVMVTHTSQLVSYGTRAVEMAAGTIVPGEHGQTEAHCK
jgi:ABC-type lipoprotein export system ATPase subunit